MFEEFRKDYFRYTGSWKIKMSVMAKDHSLRYLFFLRGGGCLYLFENISRQNTVLNWGEVILSILGCISATRMA